MYTVNCDNDNTFRFLVNMMHIVVSSTMFENVFFRPIARTLLFSRDVMKGFQ